MRDPDRDDELQYRGGRAAERLREFLTARFGPDAPVIPPDGNVADDDLVDVEADDGGGTEDESSTPES